MIAVRGVRFAYGQSAPVVVCESLDVAGGLTLLLGANGAGKSTFLKLLAGVEHPTAGTITVEARDMWRDEVEARRRIAYIPEHPDLTPYATLTEVMRLVCSLRGAPLDRGVAALTSAGLDGLGQRTVRELSMGQRRRAMLAAALVGEPSVLLFDEPLEAMDRGMREWIVEWIGMSADRGATVIIATHDVEPFAGIAVRALVVEGGVPRLVEPLSANYEERIRELDEYARLGRRE